MILVMMKVDIKILMLFLKWLLILMLEFLLKKEKLVEKLLVFVLVILGWLKNEMWGEHALVYVKDGPNSVIYFNELPDGINKEFQGKFFEDCKVSSKK